MRQGHALTADVADEQLHKLARARLRLAQRADLPHQRVLPALQLQINGDVRNNLL